MASRIFVTGSTGFVGTAVLQRLLETGLSIAAIVRDGLKQSPDARISFTPGDLFNPAALDRALAGCDAVIHLVGIIAEQPSKGVTFQHIHVDGTRAVLEATMRAGVRRYVHMSANGTRPNAVSEYHKTKWAAEELVRGSGLDWTIFRPSLIHGPGGEFANMEAAWAKGQKAPWAVMPYFGAGVLGLGGAGLLQPVFVDDVARAFVEALSNEKTINQTYSICGDETLTWPQMHKQFAAAIAHKPNRATMAIPAWYAKAVAAVMPGSVLPFNKDQVQMSQEDNAADMSTFIHDFGWQPRGLGETLPSYADSLSK